MNCSIDRRIHDVMKVEKKYNQHKNKQQYDATLVDLYSFLGHLLPENKLRILDAGCAYGTFSAFLAGLGHEVHAIDAMPELHSKEWLDKYGVKFKKVNLETDSIDMFGFDLIYFTEVIEHLNYNPVPVIEKLYKALRPGGELICTTPMKELQGVYHPNEGRYAQYIHYRDIPMPWNGYTFHDDHHYFYRKTELAQLFHEVGFKIVETYPIRQGTTHYIRVRKI